MTVALVTDSTAYLPDELAAEHRVSVVPLRVFLGARQGRDVVDIGPAEVAATLAEPAARVGTSRPAPAEFAARYRALLAEGASGVVSVHLSRRLSGTWEAARVAAEEVNAEVGGGVRVVDSRSTGMGLGFAVLAAARAAAAVTGLGLDRVGTTIAAAQVAAAAGEHDEVVRLLDPLATPTRLGRLADPGVSQWPCVLAESLVALDRVGEADAVLAPYERRSAELGRRLACSAAARVRARIQAIGDRTAADRTLRTAVTLADDAGGTVEGALARLDHGALLRRSGRRREAAASLQAAGATLSRMGAGPVAARCADELDACGLTPAPRGSGHGRRLTPRETAVARLVADGMTNPQVAAALVVSLNTVEYHLRNVFGKLGISARSEVGGHLD